MYRAAHRLIMLQGWLIVFVSFAYLGILFAALGGWLLLDETLSTRGLAGCGLMFSGMLLSQLWGMMRQK